MILSSVLDQTSSKSTIAVCYIRAHPIMSTVTAPRQLAPDVGLARVLVAAGETKASHERVYPVPAVGWFI